MTGETVESRLSYAATTICAAADVILEHADYGTLVGNFGITADLWSAYLGVKLEPADVSQLMVLLKIGRARSGEYDEDNYTDQIGYSGISAALAYPDILGVPDDIASDEDAMKQDLYRPNMNAS